MISIVLVAGGLSVFVTGAVFGSVATSTATKKLDIELTGELEETVEKLNRMPERLEAMTNQQSLEEAHLVAFRYRIKNQARKLKEISNNNFCADYPKVLNELAETTKRYYKAEVKISEFLDTVNRVITTVLLTQKILLEDYQKVVNENIELRNKIRQWGRGVDFTQASVQELAQKYIRRPETKFDKEEVFQMILSIDEIIGSIHDLANQREVRVIS